MTELKYSAEALFSAIEYLAKQSQEHSDELKSYVERARDNGMSWAEIGEALGMSKQGAWHRYGRGEGRGL